MDRGVVIPSIGRSPSPARPGLRHGAPRPFPRLSAAKLARTSLAQGRGDASLPEDVMNRIGRTLGVFVVGLAGLPLAFPSSPSLGPILAAAPGQVSSCRSGPAAAPTSARGCLADRLTDALEPAGRGGEPSRRRRGRRHQRLHRRASDDHVLLYTPTSSFTAHPYQHDKLPYDPTRALAGRAHLQHAGGPGGAGIAQCHVGRRLRSRWSRRSPASSTIRPRPA